MATTWRRRGGHAHLAQLKGAIAELRRADGGVSLMVSDAADHELGQRVESELRRFAREDVGDALGPSLLQLTIATMAHTIAGPMPSSGQLLSALALVTATIRASAQRATCRRMRT